MAFAWEGLFTYTDTTGSTAITEIRYRINEDTEDLVTDLQLLASINSGLKKLSVDTGLNFDVCSDTVVAGTYSYTLPSNIGNIYDICLLNNNIPVFLIETNESDGNTMFNSYWYYRKGNTIVISSQINSGTIKIYAQRKPLKLITVANYIELPEEYLEVLYTYIEFTYWKRAREVEEITITKMLYDEGVQKIKDDMNKFLPTGSYGYGEKS
jgi:hypothetical protein